MLVNPVFVNKDLLGHRHIHSFALVAFTLQWQSWIVATDSEWPTEPMIFTIQLFLEKFANSWTPSLERCLDYARFC